MQRINVYYTGRFSQLTIACIDGVAVVSNVDRANSDGTGVACLDCEEGWADHVARSLDEMKCVQSYYVR